MKKLFNLEEFVMVLHLMTQKKILILFRFQLVSQFPESLFLKTYFFLYFSFYWFCGVKVYSKNNKNIK